MCWLKRDMWRVGIALAGMLLLLVLMVWVPVSVGAYQGASGLATPIMGTATPTVDATVTALSKEKLKQEVKQLQEQNDATVIASNKEKLQHGNDWLWNFGATILSILFLVGGALIGFGQWLVNRNDIRTKESNDRKDAQDKDLKAQTEERFKTAVTALGDENEATQVGGAILLRSFLNKGDEKIYSRYYTQIFDLAVAYLCLPTTSRPSEDPDGLPPAPEEPNTPLPITPLRQALITVFKEAFPLARNQNKGKLQSLSATGSQQDRTIAYLSQAQFFDAGRVQLDNAFLMSADLEQVWMPRASLRGADLRWANLTVANLGGANLSRANLAEASLRNASLIAANLGHTYLRRANLGRAYLRGADLSGANLTEADLTEVLFGNTLLLQGTDLRGVKGLTKKQLEACKAKGAIIDEDTTTDSSQSATATPAPSQSRPDPTSAAPPAQVNTPPPSTDGSGC